MSLLSLVIALTAIGVAAWAMVMAWPQREEAAQPTAESKEKVCAAFDTVSKAVQLQTHADLGARPRGPDRGGEQRSVVVDRRG